MQDIIVVAAKAPDIRFACSIARQIVEASKVSPRIKQYFKFTGNASDEQKCRDLLDTSPSGTAIFFLHGDAENIFGYYSKYNNSPRYSPLITYPKNHRILKGLAVVAICCSAAKMLGRKAVEEEIAKAYFGFNEEIGWPHGHAKEKAYKKYLTDVFSSAIISAIENRSSFDEFNNDVEDRLLSKIKVYFGKEAIRGTPAFDLAGKLIAARYCGGDVQHRF